MKKKHAQHNENACNFLFRSKKYNDWVITSAFYSALHYVHHEIFPLTENGKTFNNFDNYFSYHKSTKSGIINKHTMTKNLVKIYIPNANAYYTRLFDFCMNARYVNYRISFAKAKKSRDDLADIKKHLKK